MKQKKLLPKIDDRWTLFLDRDGTINKRLVAKYVQDWSQFEFLDGVVDAIPVFNRFFSRVIIVTNQQGVGKELMTHQDVEQVHHHMLEKIWEAGGQIDEIYYCSDLEIYDPISRKPNPGMALQAQRDFPEINFRRSIMVGDQPSDIEFGNRLEMFTVKIWSDRKVEEADLEVTSLSELAALVLEEIFIK